VLGVVKVGLYVT